MPRRGAPRDRAQRNRFRRLAQGSTGAAPARPTRDVSSRPLERESSYAVPLAPIDLDDHVRVAVPAALEPLGLAGRGGAVVQIAAGVDQPAAALSSPDWAA